MSINSESARYSSSPQRQSFKGTEWWVENTKRIFERQTLKDKDSIWKRERLAENAHAVPPRANVSRNGLLVEVVSDGLPGPDRVEDCAMSFSPNNHPANMRYSSDLKGGSGNVEGGPRGSCDYFAWSTSEWSLAADTFELLRYSKPFDETASNETAATAAADRCSIDTSSSRDGEEPVEKTNKDGRVRYVRGRGRVHKCSAGGCPTRVRQSCSGVSEFVRRDDDLHGGACHHPHPHLGVNHSLWGKKDLFKRRAISSVCDLQAPRRSHHLSVDAKAHKDWCPPGYNRWSSVFETRSLEISVDAEPATLLASRERSPVWNLVKRVTTLRCHRVRGDGDFSEPLSLRSIYGEVEETEDVEGEEEEAELLSSVACAMLPGSTRFLVSAHSRCPGLGLQPTLMDIVSSLPKEGVMGRNIVTVSTFDEDPDFAHVARHSADGRIDKNLIGLAQGWTVTVDTKLGHPCGEPHRLCPMPPGLDMCPIAVMGKPFVITGLKGHERVHIFGQKMKPASLAVSASGGSIRFLVPMKYDGPKTPIVPGFLSVQVLARNQPASGTEFRRVLFVSDDNIRDELIALMRGAGVVVEDNENDDDEDDEYADPRPFRRKTTSGFIDAGACNRFIKDLAWLFEAHYRSLLYVPSSRKAAQRIIDSFRILVGTENAPETAYFLEEIEIDIDSQEDTESEEETISQCRHLEAGALNSDKAVYMAVKPHSLPATQKHAAVAKADTANNDLKLNDELDNVLFPLSFDQWFFTMWLGSVLFFFCAFIAGAKAREWGLSKSGKEVMQIQTGGILIGFFFLVANHVKSLQTWLKLRLFDEKSAGSTWIKERIDQGYPFVICCQNAVISTLFPMDKSVLHTRWIIATACMTINLVCVGLLRAELAHYKAFRYDLILEGALLYVAFYVAQIYVHGHALFLTEYAFSSFANSILALFVFPVMTSTLARQLYRKEIRVYHRHACANKLKKLE